MSQVKPGVKVDRAAEPTDFEVSSKLGGAWGPRGLRPGSMKIGDGLRSNPPIQREPIKIHKPGSM